MTAAAPAAFRKGYVDTSFGQMHYRAAGEGRPLVLLHQTPSSSMMWEPVIPLFAAAGYRCVAFDMPGFGLSDSPREQPDIAVYADAMTEAARNLGMEQFDVVGHHTGVTVAMIQALRNPEAVRKLVLWGVPMLSEERMAAMRAEKGAVYSETGEELSRAWVNRARMSRQPVATELKIRWMIERLQLGTNNHWAHVALAHVDHAATLKQITQPMLLMCGQLDTSTWQATLDATKVVPGAAFVAIENASLDVADEYPDAFVRAVDGFLSER